MVTQCLKSGRQVEWTGLISGGLLGLGEGLPQDFGLMLMQLFVSGLSSCLKIGYYNFDKNN